MEQSTSQNDFPLSVPQPTHTHQPHKWSPVGAGGRSGGLGGANLNQLEPLMSLETVVWYSSETAWQPTE